MSPYGVTRSQWPKMASVHEDWYHGLKKYCWTLETELLTDDTTTRIYLSPKFNALVMNACALMKWGIIGRTKSHYAIEYIYNALYHPCFCIAIYQIKAIGLNEILVNDVREEISKPPKTTLRNHWMTWQLRIWTMSKDNQTNRNSKSHFSTATQFKGDYQKAQCKMPCIFSVIVITLILHYQRIMLSQVIGNSIVLSAPCLG